MPQQNYIAGASLGHKGVCPNGNGLRINPLLGQAPTVPFEWGTRGGNAHQEADSIHPLGRTAAGATIPPEEENGMKAALITAAAISLAACTSIHDEATQQCTAYGLHDDPHCIMTVSENIRTRQRMTLSAISRQPVYQPQPIQMRPIQ